MTEIANFFVAVLERKSNLKAVKKIMSLAREEIELGEEHAWLDDRSFLRI